MAQTAVRPKAESLSSFFSRCFQGLLSDIGRLGRRGRIADRRRVDDEDAEPIAGVGLPRSLVGMRGNPLGEGARRVVAGRATAPSLRPGRRQLSVARRGAGRRQGALYAYKARHAHAAEDSGAVARSLRGERVLELRVNPNDDPPNDHRVCETGERDPSVGHQGAPRLLLGNEREKTRPETPLRGARSHGGRSSSFRAVMRHVRPRRVSLEQ